jgi:hypothetical protein
MLPAECLTRKAAKMQVRGVGIADASDSVNMRFGIRWPDAGQYPLQATELGV